MAIPVQPAQGIYVNAGPGRTTPLDLAFGYLRVLNVIMGKTLMNYTANVGNPSQVVQLGTAKYHLGRRVLPKDYVATDQPDKPQAFVVNVAINNYKMLAITLETFDLQQLGAVFNGGSVTLSSALLNGWLASRAQSTMLLSAAKLTKCFVNRSATPGTITNLPVLNAAGNPDVPDTMLLSDYLQKNVWWPIVNQTAKIRTLITSSYALLENDMFVLQVSLQAYNMIIGSTNNLSDTGRQAIIDLEISVIGGIKIVVNPLLGVSHAAGTLDKNDGFDFTSVDMIYSHKEAVAFPYLEPKMQMTYNPLNMNINFLQKWAYPENDGAILRPTLIHFFKFTASAGLNNFYEQTKLVYDGNIEQLDARKKELENTISKNLKSIKGQKTASELNNEITRSTQELEALNFEKAQYIGRKPIKPVLDIKVEPKPKPEKE